MVLEAFVQALQSFGIPGLWLFMMMGVIIGIIVGIIPGIGPMVAIAVLLPFIFGMPAEQALPLLVAIGTVSFTGGAVTAVLLGIPGDTPNVATIIDGFPMTQKGEGGRALGAAVTSSGAGNFLTVLMALALVPVVLLMIMTLRSGDMVFLVLTGLVFIAALSRGKAIKGLVSAGLGLLVSFIGYQAATGVLRFTFGSLYLFDGIPLVPLTLGIFALPEIIALAIKGGAIAKVAVSFRGIRGLFEGAKDVFRHWTLVIRSSIIGFIIGIIPGIGAMTAIWIAYGQAKQTSKHPETFGTGNVEGVIAPESANNAKEAGAMLTTLALGIPGSSEMVLILAAMMLVGLTPGPEMITKHLDLSLTLLMIIVASSIIGAAICFLFAPYLVKIAYISGRIIVPVVLVFIFIGSFAQSELFVDVIMLVIFGVVGVAMDMLGFNKVTFLLAFVLGYEFEKYLFLALKMAGPFFFLTPISLILILLIIALFAFGPVKRLFRRPRGVRVT